MSKSGLYFRLDDDMVEQFKKTAKSCGMSYTRYMKLMILHPPTIIRAADLATDDIDIEAVAPMISKGEVVHLNRELTRQGKNLNQAARALSILSSRADFMNRSSLSAFIDETTMNLEIVQASQESLLQVAEDILKRAM